MLKALFKKQMLELNSWLFWDKRNNKRRSGSRLFLFGLLYVFLLISLGVLFFGVAISLTVPLFENNMGWFFFTLMGLIAIVLGTFGSIFNTYAGLYQAKDNELLLSMPIPPRDILIVRLFGVWFWGTVFVALVWVPSLLAYLLSGYVTVSGVIGSILALAVLSVLVLVLSCILGWVVAKISAKVKHKSLVTVAASLTFIVLYYLVYFKAINAMDEILANISQTGAKIQSAAYPLYLFGRAAEGHPLSLFITVAAAGALLVLTYTVLSHSFLKIVTTNPGAVKKQYKQKAVKCKSADAALLSREARHLLSSPTYLLNAAIGALLIPIVAVLFCIKGGQLMTLAETIGNGFSAYLPPIFCATLCMLDSMTMISCSAVSLEGNTLWLVQSLPITPWQALKAKLNLHLIAASTPLLFCSVCVDIVARPALADAILILVFPQLFSLLTAAGGLMINLKLPNLNWKNEVVVVKQGMSVAITLFGQWGLVVLLGLLYWLVHSFVSPTLYLTCCSLLIAVSSLFCLHWLKTRGSQIFARL